MSSELLKGDKFSFFIPLQKSSESDDEQRIFEGITSTVDKDLQRESVVQKGIDIGYFVKHGNLNWDHKTGPENIVGIPLKCEHRDEGLYVKGLLLNGHPRADAIWTLANALEKSGTDRRLGFSIEGRVIRKSASFDGDKKIEACWLQAIAITANPINTNTFLDIAKALNQESWCDPKTRRCYPLTLEDVAISKGTEAGYNDPRAIGGVTASEYRIESLDSNLKVMEHSAGCSCRNDDSKEEDKKDKKDKKFSKAEACVHLQEFGLPKRMAEVMSDYSFLVDNLF